MSATWLFGFGAARRGQLIYGGLLLAGLMTACGDSSSHGQGNVDASLPESVSALIDEKGGTLQASGVTVEVPPGALKGKVRISATKSKQDAYTAKTATKVVSEVYKFGPEGTKFDKDVKVSFPVTADDSKANDLEKVAVYFTKEDDTTTYEKLPTEKDSKSDVVSANVRHFSAGFAGIPLDMDGGVALDASTNDAGVAMDAGKVADTGPQPRFTSIVVNTHDANGVSINLSWAAYQDGDDAWLPLAVSGTTGVYKFQVKNARYGVAFVCGTPGTASYGTIHYAASTTTKLDVTNTGPACTQSPAPSVDGVSGTAALQTGDGYIRFGSPYVDNYTEPTNGTYSAWSMAARNLPTDLMFGSATYNYKGLTAYGFVRDFVSTADPSTVNVDLSSSKSLVGPDATVTVTNLRNPIYNIPVEYTTKGASMGMSLVNGDVSGAVPSYAVAYSTIPEADRVSSDRYVVNVSEGASTGANVDTSRTNFTSFYASGNISVALPSDFNATLSVPNAPDAGYVYVVGSDAGAGTRFFPSYKFDAYPGATSYLLGWNYVDVSNTNYHGFDITFEPGWLEGASTETYAFPDLSTATGFDVQWLPPTVNELGNNTLQITGTAVHEDTTGGVYTKTTSQVTYYYPYAIRG